MTEHRSGRDAEFLIPRGADAIMLDGSRTLLTEAKRLHRDLGTEGCSITGGHSSLILCVLGRQIFAAIQSKTKQSEFIVVIRVSRIMKSGVYFDSTTTVPTVARSNPAAAVPRVVYFNVT